MTSSERLPGYGRELPSQHMILDSLARYLDDEEIPEIWEAACRQAGVDVGNPPTSAEELLPLVDALERCGDLAAVCAKGLRIRIMSYLVLSRSYSKTVSPAGL